MPAGRLTAAPPEPRHVETAISCPVRALVVSEGLVVFEFVRLRHVPGEADGELALPTPARAAGAVHVVLMGHGRLDVGLAALGRLLIAPQELPRPPLHPDHPPLQEL